MPPRLSYSEPAINLRRWQALKSRLPQRRYIVKSTEAVEKPGRGLYHQDRKEDEALTESLQIGETADDQGKAQNEDLGTLELPLSPLMDPSLLAARNRYRTQKPDPSGEPSEFQKKLSKNPYAQALATPVRSCAITGVRLPNYFLLDFSLAPHPRTGKPWQMPRLALDPNVADPNKVSSAEQTLEQIGTASNDDSTLIGAKARGQKPAQAVAGCYIVSQRPAIKLMSDVKRTSYMQMVPHRWKMDARFKADDIIWRKDMDTFVLDLMRKKVVKLLKYLSSKPAAYVAKCEDYENIQSKHQPGAVLWLGESNGNAVSKINHEPSPYAMVKYRSACQIPVYNIPALLGPDCLGQLRDSSEPFKNTLVVIKQKRNTLETLMHLWKMMGYMASNTDPGQQAHVD